jgi:light-regulated signal transduction histidine kinase (bacteriophytochrome)
LEIEKAGSETVEDVFSQLAEFTGHLARQGDIAGSLEVGARFVQELTGFDRALIYRFDSDWNGQVIAEAGNGQLPTYLDLRFPGSDIPAQARALYVANRVRMIPDVDYAPVLVEPDRDPETGDLLDLSQAQLRSVSPVHREYMRNMGTAASMSVSILVDGRLWGLLSCHSARPHQVSDSVRSACDFVAQSLAMKISALQHAETAARGAQLAQVTGRLVAAMSSSQDWFASLSDMQEDLTAQVAADGVAVVQGMECHRLGKTPDELEVRSLVSWLEAETKQDIFASHSMVAYDDRFQDMVETGSGVLAIRLSRLHASWVIWFRPEVIQTVKWGGDPHKAVQESGRIHPRQSFDTWREQVRFTALEWTQAEIEAAQALRTGIVNLVLRQAEERAQLTSELERSNKELEAFSYSVSHDLRAPFRHIVGFAQLLRERERGMDQKSQHYLQTISEAALAAGRLVDDLLNFSQLGRASIIRKPVDMNKLISEVIRSIGAEMDGRNIEWSIGSLPFSWGDATLLRQVWFNLIENSVKYTRHRDVARIEISGENLEDTMIYRIRDNGVGFDMAYVGKLFGVFQRLQRSEDFEGTGIGLALVRRIIERHNGSIRAEGQVNEGATFIFALPSAEKKGRALA